MTHEPPNLGQKLGGTRSIPEWIQVTICIGGLVLFAVLWKLDVASLPVLVVGNLSAVAGLFAIAHFIPAFRSTLRLYEHGLEIIVQGTSTAFTFDEVHSMTAKFTDHLLNHQYVGTQVRIEFFLDGRLKPCTFEGEFRQDSGSQKLVAVAIDRCSRVIERRLLADLEHQGNVRWRDNVHLSANGILLIDSPSVSRLIPYDEIADWKIVDNDLKIWKADDALPFLMMGNETPNFAPLFGLFETLCRSARTIAGPRNPKLAGPPQSAWPATVSNGSTGAV